MAKQLLLGIVLLAAAVSPAGAEPTWTLSANQSTYSYFCKGDDWVVIEGKGNDIAISGDCARLDVSGENNRVRIESVASIRVNGNNNDVRYGGKASLKIKGSANSVRRQ